MGTKISHQICLININKIYITLALLGFLVIEVPAQSDFSIEFVQFNNGTVTATDTITLVFKVKNLAGEFLVSGDTLYFSARINCNYFDS